MGDLSRFIILLIVLVLGDKSFSRSTSFNPFPLGTIGCLVSNICGSGEICKNDLAFGRCQSVFSRTPNAEIKFELTTDEISALEDEISRLKKNHFKWKDALTQCILQNMLTNFRFGRIFNKGVCEEALELATDEVNRQFPRVFLQLPNERILESILEQPRNVKSDIDLLSSNKRDEIIQLHKYFDESRGQQKRDPYLGGPASIYQNQIPTQHLHYHPQHVLPGQDDEDVYIQLVNSDGNRYDVSKPDAPTRLPYSGDLLQVKNTDNMNQQHSSIEGQDNNGNPSIKSNFEKLFLTSRDQETLEELLEGTVSPTDLDIGQRKRLQIFIENLIRVLETSDGSIELVYENDKVPPENPPLPEEFPVHETTDTVEGIDSQATGIVYPMYR